MGFPIRITYVENADYLIEGQKQFPQSTRPLIPEKTQNLFCAILILGAMGYALFEEYQKGVEVRILIVGGIFAILILAFWSWFFKKIGLKSYYSAREYKWTDKDHARMKNSYFKSTGRTESTIICDFDEAGFHLGLPDGKNKDYAWLAIRRAVEGPHGLYIFTGTYFHLWFPKAAFDSNDDYCGAISLIKTKVPKFERITVSNMAVIAIGSNLGVPKKNILSAMEQLRRFSDARLMKSALWQTAPVHCPPGSPMFINAVVALLPRSGETPESLLKKLQTLEKKFGRRPKKVVNEARPLDLDLITFGHATRNTQQLILPHPRAHERRFVLQPLSEIAPDLILPGQSKTVAQLLAGLPPDETIKKLG